MCSFSKRLIAAVLHDRCPSALGWSAGAHFVGRLVFFWSQILENPGFRYSRHVCYHPLLVVLIVAHPSYTLWRHPVYIFCRGVGWGVEGKQVGSMNEEPQVRGCYNRTFICTSTNQETVFVLEKTQANKTFRT